MLHPLFRLSSSRRVFIFLVIPIVLSLLLVARFANVGSAENDQQPPAPKENVQKEINPQSDNQLDNKPHSLFGSYYSIDDGLTATLLLNNKGPQTLEVNPTLYSLSGQQLELPPVFVEPTSFQNINLSEWAGIGGEDFRQGSIKLFHRGKDLVLGAQIHLVDQAHSLSFEEKLAEIGNSDSRRLEGIWLMPSREANVKIVLSNTTDIVLTVAASLTRRPHNTSEAKNFQLQPHETRILDLRRDFPDGEKAANSEAVALSLEHCGTKEALLARTFISEPERGYSNLAQFSNPLKGKSKEYQGVGLQLGKVAGERLTPVVVARNTAGTDANITGRVPYTRVDGTTGNIALEATRLRPNEIKLLDLRRVVQRSEQEQIKIAGLEIEYDTAEGSVRIAAHSQSTSRNQVFRVPMWDPFGQRSPTGGYPWQIENTSTTKTYIKNITDREQYYVAYLSWENDGRYMIGMKQIAPHQTIEIDLKQLRDEQIPDEAGEVIPLHVTKGQLKWSLKQVSKEPPGEEIRQALALIGRTEQIDVENGISSNYACQNCCGDSYDSSFLTPGGGETEVDTVIDFDVYQRDRDCYNVPTPYYLRTPSKGFTSWNSSDTSVATVNDSIVTSVGAGDITIKASWQDQINYLSEGYPCDIFLKEAASCSSNYAESIQVIATNVRTKRKVKSQEQLLRPPCGPYCASYSFVPTPSAVLIVKPKVEINVPATAKDGDTVDFSVSVKGTTPTGYQWSFEAPSGAGNNPQVNFTPPTSAQTKAKAHWFANPNSDCATVPPRLSETHPYYNSKYKIKVKVTYKDNKGNNKDTDKSGDFTVNAWWSPGGSVAPATNSGGPQTGFDSSRNLYVVLNSGTMVRNTNSAVINVPQTSQFYNKTVKHEEKHELQWASGLFKDIWTVSSFMAVISNFTDTTAQGLSAQIGQAYLTWDAQQVQSYHNNFNAAEIEAYAISDLIAPQYAYQRCGRTVFR